MKNAIIIYLRAMVLYALFTLPAALIPIIYFMSLYCVLRFGWFACALFIVLYLAINKLRIEEGTKRLLLQGAVILSVLFSFEMLDLFEPDLGGWEAGLFLLFPFVACVAGWVSVGIGLKKRQNLLDNFLTEKDETTMV